MTEEDLETMPEQLSHILELFRVLQELDTEDVPPTGHSVSVETVVRADEPQSSLSTEDVLANAPRREGDVFRVNIVLE
jgi:aspartyl-tRNA(Asn)/glutamyl-tRNA(Gln) amidotransferase subunit C